MGQIIDSTMIGEALRAKVTVSDDIMAISFSDAGNIKLSRLLIIERREYIIWDRVLTEGEQEKKEIIEDFSGFVSGCRSSRLRFNYVLAIEFTDDNDSKQIAFIRDSSKVFKTKRIERGGYNALDRAYAPVSLKDIRTARGRIFEELMIVPFLSEKDCMLSIRISIPEQITDTLIRGSVKKMKFSGSSIKLVLLIPKLESDIKSMIFWNKKSEKKVSIDFSLAKGSSAWTITATIDLDKIDTGFPFWKVLAETELSGRNVTIQFNVDNKLNKYIRLVAPQGTLSNGNIVYLKPDAMKTAQFVIREKTKYDTKVVKLKEVIAMAAYKFTKKRTAKRQIWLVFEKFCSMAQDNGVAFYRYCMEELSSEEKKDIYYIIEGKTPAYDELKKYGRNTVKFMSIKHIYLCLAAKTCVASESKRHLYVWRGKPSYIEKFIRKKDILFLQHGVTALKRVDVIFGKGGTDPMTYFTCTSEQEQKIVTENFGYTKKEAPILGFTRWDSLVDSSSKDNPQILVMPTWRKWLQDMTPKEFKESEYFDRYSDLLQDKELNRKLKENNVRMVFYIHPKFMEYADSFFASADNVDLVAFGEQPLNKLLMSCNMLITDYSSVCWDFYYMKKPVIFYQFDYDTYMTEHGSYIDMSSELFGDRVMGKDEIRDCICSYIDTRFKEKTQFVEMRPLMFRYNDRNNCSRTYQFLKNRKTISGQAAGLSVYMEHYYKDSIDHKCILLESQNGRKVDGSIHYIIRELLSDDRYKDFRIYVSVGDEGVKENLINSFGRSDRLQAIVTKSAEYYQILAKAGYLINDATFTNSFIKKEGQIYLNLWHGTPLKHMGRKVTDEPDAAGNVTKNFLCADYLLYPNEYTKEHMIEDYMIDNLAKGEIIMCGYPRNTAFFDRASANVIREKEGLNGYRVYVYMPTWRRSAQGADLQVIVNAIDKRLRDDELLYAKLHPLADGVINYDDMEHVRKFPENYETYEFLNTADCLITDYSSVLYDFAVRERKTVLYTYDEEEYMQARGLYEPLESLPFERTDNIDELIELIRSEAEPAGMEAFRERFCSYDRPDATARLCERVILGQDNELKVEQFKPDGRENLLVYAGDLSEKATSDRAIEFLDSLNDGSCNVILTYKRPHIIKDPSVLLRLPEGVCHFGTPGMIGFTAEEQAAAKAFVAGRISFTEFWNKSRRAYATESRRHYGGAGIDRIIVYNNIHRKSLLEYSLMDCRRQMIISQDQEKELNSYAEDYSEFIREHFEITVI